MSASQFSFYALAAIILVSALLAMTTRRIFRAAIWLLFSLGGVAGLFFWMQAEFLAAVQLVVYVGGIVVLIIFSLFLTQQVGSEMPQPSKLRRLFSVLVALLGFVLIFGLVRELPGGRVSPGPFQLSVSELGAQLLSVSQHGYSLPFELASVLLLAVMVGCIVIAMKGKPVNKDKMGPKQ